DGGTTHKAEVENAINVLKTRVGKLDITTNTPGWEISVDDEVVGKTPLAKPISVSIGKRRVSATKPGETSLTRTVEVPAGDTETVALVATASPAATRDASTSDTGQPAASGGGGNTLLLVGWIGTGVLAGGAVVTGILATGAASDLKDARDAFPGNKSDID